MTVAAGVTRDFPIGPFLESATRWLAVPEDSDSRRDVVSPMPAVTVMLVRDDPLEVFMVERGGRAQTDPPTWIFPGGRVDAADADVASATTRWAEGGPDAWSEALGGEEPLASGVLGCALREVFDETGVLLASSAGDDALVMFGDAGRQDRPVVHASDDLEFAEAVPGLELRADLLAPVDRWVTPEFESRRYDTWFVTAALPAGACAQAVPRGRRQSRWVRPTDMLDEATTGRTSLLPPTLTALERLSRSHSAAEALRQARASSFDITRPRVLLGPAGPYLQAEVNL